MSDAKTLAAEKLESSGLTLADAKLLNITWSEHGNKVDKIYPDVPVLIFNYMDVVTGKPFTFKPHWPDYQRIRLLKDPAGFAAQTVKKPVRYLQPRDSGVAAYFPTNIDWKPILDDPGESLIITEGELKSAKACKEGFPTIGLGGVHSFKSSTYDLLFLPELDAVNWVKRKVYICFDSDTKTNQNVCNALNELAETLAKRGALPYVLPMPEMEGYAKTGLDDYLLEHPAAEFITLLTTAAQSLTATKVLFEYNKTHLWVANPGVIFKKGNGSKIAPAALGHHGTTDYAEKYVTTTGVAMRAVSAITAWLRWPLRTEVEALTYAPGQAQIVEPGTCNSAWNTWPGWGCEPKKGSVAPFTKLIDNLFKGAPDIHKQWFLQWLAYPIQHPGTKLFTCVMLWGVRHGTGKSFIGYTMREVYGAKNFGAITQGSLEGQFNEWAENKQFIMGDDITGSDKRHDSDRLKTFITQKEVRLNIKHIQSYVIPDCMNYYFTANGPTGLFLEDDDRRSFVHEITADPFPDEFYAEYQVWLNSSGPSAIFYYLLNEVDCSTFNPAAPAMRTAAKERMIADVRSDLAEWVNRLLTTPEEILRVGQINLHHDMFTNKDLLALYDPEGKSKTTANGLGRELRRVGARYAQDGNTIKTKKETNRFYIIRNREKWLTASLTEIQQHLNDAPIPIAKKKY